MMRRFDHVVDALEWRGQRDTNAVVYRYLQDGEGEERTITFGSLLQRASALSGALSAHAPAGERVALMLPPGADFFPIFWACLHAGLIPSVVYPPARIAPAELGPVAAICRDAGASLLITTQAIQEAMQDLSPASSASLQLPTICSLESLSAQGRHGTRRPCDVAYLQYTSGSTSAPKGARITHRGLAAHLTHLCARFAYTSESIAVSWLPVHHSFGLVAGVMIPMFAGCVSTSMSPGHFLERPLRWFEAIDRHRGTHSGGPNFAYDLAIAKLSGGEATRPLDLSCWKLAGTGGEAVQHGTLARFQSELAKVGVPRTAFAPAYGLSEATLVVTTSPYQEPLVLTVDGHALQRGEVVPCTPETDGARTMVSVGALVGGFELKLVDPTTHKPSPPNLIGEVWLRGEAVADGYWGRPDETAAVFRGQVEGSSAPYLRTGDLGFLWNGALFITGRCKELVIVRGLNFFPADLEATVRAAAPALADAPVAAFPWTGGGGDGLGIAVEVSAPASGLDGRVRARLAAEHGIEAGFLTLVDPGTLPRTGSGKLQRLRIAQLAESGKLANLHAPRRDSTAEGDAPHAPWGLEAIRQIMTELDVQVDDGLSGETTLDALALGSLAIVRLTSEVQLRYGRRIPLRLLLTPGARVADLIAANEPATAQEQTFDYLRDAQLSAEVTSALSSAQRKRGAADGPALGPILLTGATGYLGANVLQRLARTAPTRRIYCLVRADSVDQGRARLEKAAKELAGVSLPDTEPIRVVCGDVGSPQLGLATAEYQTLAREVHTVVHGAAHVNFVYPYAALRGPNVAGTEQVLLFCAAGAPKPLHFLSTVGVLATGNVEGPPRPETAAVEENARLLVGYEQSKWVADRMVTLARKTQLPAWIYRIGFVGGQTNDGALLRSNEFFPSLLRGCIALGVYPALDSAFGFVPVDWVADVIADAVLHPAGEPADLHLVHPEPMTVRGCFEQLQRAGYRVQPLPFDDWRKRLFSMPVASLRQNALFDYLEFLRPLSARHLALPAIDFSTTRRIWSEHPCQDAATLLDTCIRRLQQTNELAPPPRSAT